MRALATKLTLSCASAGYSLSEASMLCVNECDATPKQNKKYR